MDWGSEPCEESSLLGWLREGGATIHPALTLRPTRTPGSEAQAADLRAGAAELGVFAARDILEGELLFTLPEEPFALAVAVRLVHQRRSTPPVRVSAPVSRPSVLVVR